MFGRINDKKKILAIMQLPPPIHGQSIMNQAIYESRLINDSFNFKTIPLYFTALRNIGKPSIRKLFKMIYYLFIIFKELICFKPDLVYFTLSPTGFAFYRDSVYVLLIKLFRIPIIFHLQGKGIKDKSKRKIIRLLYTCVFNNSKIILLSKLLEKDLDNLIIPNTSIYYLPNAIKVYDVYAKNNSIPNNPPIILFLSNIAKTKGVLALIAATKLLVKKNYNFKVKLVGQIHQSLSENELLNLLSDPSINNKIEYIGPKFGKEKNDILDDSDIFVFPTYMIHEAFPLVILEAMQAALPVVSTFEGAIPEIIDEGVSGFLVKQKDARDLAGKIEILLNDEALRKKMGNNAKIKFFKHYTLQIFENNLNQIFKSALFNKHKRKK